MVEVKTMSQLDLCHAVKHHTWWLRYRVVTARRAHTIRALTAFYRHGLAKGHWVGPQPRVLLWPWAILRSDGIVDFSIFPWNYSISVQIKFSLNLNSS
jgi:hypothetical protein